jgi:excisionase family DNA binding protein
MLVESDKPKLLRVDQVARRLGVSSQTVRRRISSGDLPALKLGSGPKAPIRVDSVELERGVYRSSAQLPRAEAGAADIAAGRPSEGQAGS